jgi:hypothetical protein
MDVIQKVLPSTLPGGRCLPGRTPYKAIDKVEVFNLIFAAHSTISNKLILFGKAPFLADIRT